MTFAPTSNTILTISHHIFLSKEERYALFEGKDIETVGASIPIWSHNNKTSEPAVEVFVKYKLFNRKERPNVRFNKFGYEITIPPNSHYDKDTESVTDFSEPAILKNIVDFADGGCKWLAFKQNSKLNIKDNKELYVIHFVQIKDIEELFLSLT